MTDTTSTTEACQVLPVDTRGRVRVGAQRRESLLGQFDKSGMTGKRQAPATGKSVSCGNRTAVYAPCPRALGGLMTSGKIVLTSVITAIT
jgi:hypothetical protein